MLPAAETQATMPLFRHAPAALSGLVDTKSFTALESLGGTEAVLKGLGVDGSQGLLPEAEGSDSRDLKLGPQWIATLEQRREAFGQNELPQRPVKGLFTLMMHAFKDKILVLLTVAAVVSLVLGIYQATAGEKHIVYDASCPEGCQVTSLEWVEGVAIVAAIIIIVLVGSLTDWQKERQFQRLNAQREDRVVKVIRNGQERLINTKELVVGDVALLEPGEVIPVDGLLLKGHNVRVDESGVTGESDAIRKGTFAECAAARNDPRITDMPDCFMVSGGKVLEGVGSYVVVAVGINSFHGRIMTSMQGEAEPTPLQQKLNELAGLIVKVGMWSGGVLFVALMIRYFVNLKMFPDRSPSEKGQDFIQQLIIAVVLVVAAVPEGLPLAVTLALAFATNRMTKQNLLVRVLGSCETMANATVICTDKTGTLTENVMTVVRATIGNHTGVDLGSLGLSPDHAMVLNEAICINSTAFEDADEKGEMQFVGNKTEAALLRFAKQAGWADYRAVRTQYQTVHLIPFSSDLKAMGVVIKRGDTFRLYVKGAPEMLVPLCRDSLELTGTAAISDNDRQTITEATTHYASQSLRTLALCYRDFPLEPAHDTQFEEMACDLTFLSVVGIRDPLRAGVIEAVQQCHRAGVGIKICTGDNIITAQAIGKESGILTSDGLVLDGPQFRQLSESERHRAVRNLQVLARSSPEDKKLLVQTLKEQGEVVGVTGDGTNDGPALKLANVGFAMGLTGTEVAKTASDIIIMDDSFANIVVAIKTGRCVNDSVRKFVQFQLSVNVAAIILTLVSAIESSAKASILSAVQLLWVNLIMDTFAALALATDPPSDSSLDRKPAHSSAPLIDVNMAKMILGQALYQCVTCFTLHFAGYRILGTDPNNAAAQAELRTLVFNVFVFCQIFNQINCRRLDRKFNIFEGFFRNYWFLAIFLIMCGGQVLIIEVGGTAFQVTRIYGRDWAISLVVGLLSFPIGVVVRLLPSEPLYRFMVRCKLYPNPDLFEWTESEDTTRVPSVLETKTKMEV